MKHLDEAQLVEHIWDGASLSDDEVGHLNSCDDCRVRLTSLRSIAHEMDVAQASTTRPEVEARYVALFAGAQANRGGPSLVARAMQWLQAQLTFDSRTQALSAGVRNSRASSYHMHFAADVVEIELMVEPMQAQRRMVGEIIDASGAPFAPALVALTLRDGTPVFEVESDELGRFLFQGIDPGDFALVVTPSAGVVADLNTIEVGTLVIT